jgi:AhpD family alkylhydroperoxidase
MGAHHTDAAPRLQLLDTEAAGEPAKLYRLLAKSQSSLNGYLGLQNALTHGEFGLQLCTLIAIFVAEANGCVYMLSAHVAAARRAGVDGEAIADARHGRAADVRTDAALRLVGALVHAHGDVNDAELARLRAAGFDDATIIEIICNVGLNC